MEFLNYTPHTINMNDGREFSSVGVARVTSSFTIPNSDGICKVVYGEIEGLPQAQAGVKLIVSAMVLAANKTRDDLVAPATGHPLTVRNDKGHIVSVPCFVC